MIVSEDVDDFIIEYNPRNPDINPTDSGVLCTEYVDENWSIGYGNITDGEYRLNISDIGYQTIPKLYGLLDTGGLDEAGITATLNQPFLDVSGQGVIIGFIDTGIDYRLEVFKNSDNTSRIGVIWDQTIQTPADMRTNEERNLRNQLGRNSFRYGTFYTKPVIDKALRYEAQGAEAADIVPSNDENGHGTFIAGIAAGSSVEGFQGAAPECELAVVKLKPAKQYLRDFFLINDEAEAYQENDIMLAFHFLTEYAALRRMPLVICFTLGTGLGPKTGETPLGSVMGLIARRTNVVVVVPVGNEANNRTHISGKAAAGNESFPIEINVGSGEKGFAMELWANTLDVLSVSIISPSGETIPRIPARIRENSIFRFLLEGTEVNVDYRVIEPMSGNELIFIRFINPTEGIWRINVYSITNISGSFNAWLPLKQFLTGNTFFLQSSLETTLTEPSAVDWVISAGAYEYISGAGYIDSGRGYTADNRVKPDIIAPGVNIYGPKPGGGYTYKTGTSIAAAYTAGAAALLLTWGVIYNNLPLMETSDVKYILIRGAQRDASAEYPNNISGYGKINLLNSFLQLRIT